MTDREPSRDQDLAIVTIVNMRRFPNWLNGDWKTEPGETSWDLRELRRRKAVAS